MRILFISTSPTSDDRRAWSGTVYQAFKGLERAGFEVDYLSAMRDYKQTFRDKLICTYWLRVPGKFGKQTRMDESFYSVGIFRHTLNSFDYSRYDVIFVPTHIAIVNALPKISEPRLSIWLMLQLILFLAIIQNFPTCGFTTIGKHIFLGKEHSVDLK